ncbi:nucleolar transcription factor 1-like [Eurosta solidaginis]|uniref:nucleolar transcription factor 1-like n=1 Tax=Eurosta solidaginis TaxID=178769 RepID=UPI003530A3C1
MISKCKYYNKQTATAPVTTGNTKSSRSPNIKSSKYDEHYEEKQQTTDSGNSSEQEANDDDDDPDFVVKRNTYADDDDDEDEDFDGGATTNSNSVDIYETPVNRNRKRRPRNIVEYSGSNSVRSCRRQKRNSIYEEMVKSHYLRPSKTF